MKESKIDVLTIGPNKGVRVYKSIRAASRALSGTGSDEMRTTIARRLNDGGGYVGNVYVAAAGNYTAS